jgi:hypothetical protein
VRFVVTADDVLDTWLLNSRRTHQLYVYGFAAMVVAGAFLWLGTRDPPRR